MNSTRFGRKLKRNFEITSDGAHCYLSMQIVRDRGTNTLRLKQTAYVRNVLEKFNMSTCNSRSIPVDPGAVLNRNSYKDGTDASYQQAISSLMYLAVATRWDLAFSVR